VKQYFGKFIYLFKRKRKTTTDLGISSAFTASFRHLLLERGGHPSFVRRGQTIFYYVPT